MNIVISSLSSELCEQQDLEAIARRRRPSAGLLDRF